MDRQEHIHIVSAGEHIHEVYAAAVRDLQKITHTYVFADTDLYTNLVRDNERAKAYKTAAREAVNHLRTHAAFLKIPAHLVYIGSPALDSVVQAIIKIVSEHPSATYSFDLTAGSKDLSLALSTISLWLGGEAYYTFFDQKRDGSPTLLPVPGPVVGNMQSNKNYGRILALLYRAPGKQERSPRLLSRAYLYTQLESFYVPVRKKGVRSSATPSRKGPAIPRLSQGTFTTLLATMEAGNLIRQEPGPEKSRREKYFRITPAGELALLLAETKPRKQ
ncbi:MAG: hypothetical protein WAK75_01040 [Methanoregula sp.]|uniref:hypothetical protein n=1 Tax=Methanoregula sp. TaxID=2052170 RepID=UPI003BB15A14